MTPRSVLEAVAAYAGRARSWCAARREQLAGVALPRWAVRVIIWGALAVVLAAAAVGLVVLALVVRDALAPVALLWTSTELWWSSRAGWASMRRPIYTALAGSLALGVALALSRHTSTAVRLLQAGWHRFRGWVESHEALPELDREPAGELAELGGGVAPRELVGAPVEPAQGEGPEPPDSEPSKTQVEDGPRA